MSVIRYLMMLMILSHLAVKVRAESNIISRLLMNHTKLDSQIMKLSDVICAIVSANKGKGSQNAIAYDSCLMLNDQSTSFLILRINLFALRFECLLLQQDERRRLHHR